MPATHTTQPGLPTLLLPDAASWSTWLTANAPTSRGVWLVMSKRPRSPQKPTSTSTPSLIPAPTTLTLPQALDSALCHGWINGQAKSTGDGMTVMQRFTPRAKRSSWSKINMGHVARLAQEGRMREAGWREVERARVDGRWEAAYGAFSTIRPLEGLLTAIDEVPEARAAWERLTKTDRYSIIVKLANVRTPAGRERNIARAVERLANWQEGNSRFSTTKSGANSEKAAVVESDARPRPSPLRESRAERAGRRAKRLGESSS